MLTQSKQTKQTQKKCTGHEPAADAAPVEQPEHRALDAAEDLHPRRKQDRIGLEPSVERCKDKAAVGRKLVGHPRRIPRADLGKIAVQIYEIINTRWAGW
jgi:hypothetical protein